MKSNPNHTVKHKPMSPEKQNAAAKSECMSDKVTNERKLYDAIPTPQKK